MQNNLNLTGLFDQKMHWESDCCLLRSWGRSLPYCEHAQIDVDTDRSVFSTPAKQPIHLWRIWCFIQACCSTCAFVMQNSIVWKFHFNQIYFKTIFSSANLDFGLEIAGMTNIQPILPILALFKSNLDNNLSVHFCYVQFCFHKYDVSSCGWILNLLKPLCSKKL